MVGFADHSGLRDPLVQISQSGQIVNVKCICGKGFLQFLLGLHLQKIMIQGEDGAFPGFLSKVSPVCLKDCLFFCFRIADALSQERFLDLGNQTLV